ncbi:DAK2 domain-containing protein [Aquibacillus sediminis]|uniref:DAK2 domain-containing protein n=1 Tax=Aquibacillus sediminis TaxID=2574734 RepID=UPI001486C731|nr:DAK2 domain-containing protein [Aquibacillus sediminis]
MTLRTLDGNTFAQMVLTGANHLTNNAQMIDALNVFPVPDGDTGTNMNLSMTSGAEEVKVANNQQVAEVAQALAKGLLMGARGNSGVILSQLFRGFAKGVEGKTTLSTIDFAKGFEEGVNTAYKAVIKPVEGTILTVAKDSSAKAKELASSTDNVIEFMEGVVKAAKASLQSTPDLLPVLKEVGVVDSGGQGLVTIYEGFLASLKGEELPETSETTVDLEDMVNAEHHKLAQDFMDTDQIEFGYCTEFMVKFEQDKLQQHPFSEEEFRNELSEYGDSLLVVSDDELVKVHVHVEYPGEVINLGQRFGSFVSIKVENMRQQHTSIVGDKKEPAKPAEKLENAIVSVAMGDGIKELLESLGVNVVIQGGQTMNPSTQDITDAINQANAKNIVILPNNKNIVMAAEQAAKLAEENVVVVPTKTIPQGMSALLAYHPEAELADNKKNMIEASKQVKTGQITYAVRDTQIEGMTIENGNFMGLADGKIKATDKDQLEATKLLIQEMLDEDDEIITILQGEDASDEEVQKLEQYIEDNYDEVEIEIHKGNQPIYSYIISIE